MKKILSTLTALASLTIASFGQTISASGTWGSTVLTITPTTGTVLGGAAGYDYNISMTTNLTPFYSHGGLQVQRGWEDASGNIIFEDPANSGERTWPANSAGNGQTRSYGPFTTGYTGGDCSSGTATPVSYETEVVQIILIDDSGNRTVIATFSDQLYPFNPQQITPPTMTVTSFTHQITAGTYTAVPTGATAATQMAALTNNFKGDAPRISAALTNLYPGATVQLYICPNDPIGNPNFTAKAQIGSNILVGPVGPAPLYQLPSATVIVELGTAMQSAGWSTTTRTPQEFTVMMAQTLPSAITSNPPGCANLTQPISYFSFIQAGFAVNGQIGKLTP